MQVNRYKKSVSKSLNNMSAQVIDDKIMKTLVSASSLEKEIKLKKKKKIEKSNLELEHLANSKRKKYEKVYFDRGEKIPGDKNKFDTY